MKLSTIHNRSSDLLKCSQCHLCFSCYFISCSWCRLIHSVSKSLAEHGDKVDPSIKEEVEKALSEAKGVSSDAELEVVQAKSSA